MFGLRFSLKRLLGLFVLISVALVAVDKWRSLGRVDTRFIDPTSVEAKNLLAQPVVAADEGRPTAEFRANYRDVRWLFTKAETMVAMSGGLEADFDNDRVVIQTARVDDLKQLIALMSEADQLGEDHAVVRGIAVDEDNHPIANLPVDLLGPTKSLNTHWTRPDGSFSVPVKFTPSDDYSMRFRRSYAETYETMPFSLGESKREVVIRVIIPRNR